MQCVTEHVTYVRLSQDRKTSRHLRDNQLLRKFQTKCGTLAGLLSISLLEVWSVNQQFNIFKSEWSAWHMSSSCGVDEHWTAFERRFWSLGRVANATGRVIVT